MVLKLSSMGGSDSPPPTIIIEDNVEQDADSQNDIPKSFKIQIDILAAIIGLIMFITGTGVCVSGSSSAWGIDWAYIMIIGFFILLLSPILWAAKKLFFKKIVDEGIASNEVDDSSEPEIRKMHKSMFLIGMVSVIFGWTFNSAFKGYKMQEDFFVPVCMGYFMMIFSGLLAKYNNDFRRIMKWGMKIFITIFIPGMVIFFVLDYIISGQPFF